MLLSILILILLLPFTFLSLALDTFFSSDDLRKMGIYLENSEALYSESITIARSRPCNSETACQLWDVIEQVMA